MGHAMKRQARRRDEYQSVKSMVKTTLIVPEVMNRNLEIYSALNGISKNDAVVKCIHDQLSASGFKPDQYPKNVVYHKASPAR